MSRPSDLVVAAGGGPGEGTDPSGADPSASDRAWALALPKAELHLHLSGSLRPATALRLARERRRFPELPDAALMARMVAAARCADQAELLRAFDVPVALLQDREALAVAAAELVEDLAADGVGYAEIRFAPVSHTRGGLSVAQTIEAVAAAVRSAQDAPVEVRLITIAMRTDPPQRSLEVARAAAAAQDRGVRGFDLAGPEATAPDIAPHLPAFRLAREAGLGISAHAGEWGGAAQVRAVLAAHPDRIAHGGPAADDPALMRELIDRGITLDLCPTSNVQAALVPRMEDHPLPHLLRAGVPVTLSTDDRTVSATTLTDEVLLALGPLGLTRREVVGLQRHALRAAFFHPVDAPTRDRLQAGLDAWIEQHEETLDP